MHPGRCFKGQPLLKEPLKRFQAEQQAARHFVGPQRADHMWFIASTSR